MDAVGLELVMKDQYVFGPHGITAASRRLKDLEDGSIQAVGELNNIFNRY